MNGLSFPLINGRRVITVPIQSSIDDVTKGIVLPKMIPRYQSVRWSSMSPYHLVIYQSVKTWVWRGKHPKPVQLEVHSGTSRWSVVLVAGFLDLVDRLLGEESSATFGDSLVGVNVHVMIQVHDRCPETTLRAEDCSIGANFVCGKVFVRDRSVVIVRVRHPLAVFADVNSG